VAEVLTQRGADLGERLYNALTEAALDHSLVAVAGSDLPGLDAATVEEAFDRLHREDDVVLGPAADGGYYLLAVRAERLHPRLFANVAWSSDRVLAQTIERCGELGLRWSTLSSRRDVDRPQDLEWLEASLRDGLLVSPRVADWLRRRQASGVAAASTA
jgi:rSAM/selenodomain-associated transferase 1